MTTQVEPARMQESVVSEQSRGAIVVESAEGARAPYEGVESSEDLEQLLETASRMLRRRLRPSVSPRLRREPSMPPKVRMVGEPRNR